MAGDLNNPLRFYYKNWKGKCGYRNVLDPKLWFGKTPYHKKPQWLMRAYDIDKGDVRDFAVNDIIEFVREV